MLDHREDNAVVISPDNLALVYLSNNDALRFFMEIGINMELFFRVLWRHILISELVKIRFDLSTETKANNFFQDLSKRFFKNKIKEIARDYLINRGQNFWKETDYRVKEMTTTMTTDLGSAVSGKLEGAIPGFARGEVQLNPNLAKKLTEEQKIEIVNLGQSVVNGPQIRELSEVLNIMEEDLLDDKKKHYYIIVDKLDENWVNDNFRFRLIRALIETARDLNSKLSNVKVVVAVREDLLDRVFRYTRDAGEQEEKYHTLYLQLSWKPAQLAEILKRRINQLIQNQYAKNDIVEPKDVLPSKILKEKDAVRYLIDRTLYTPRDIILFFNECIAKAEGSPTINQTQLLAAEGRFSDLRLRALADEWSADYPNLIHIILFFKKAKPKFSFLEIDLKEFEQYALDFLTSDKTDKTCYFYRYTQGQFESPKGWNVKDTFFEYARILYRVGFWGIKRDTFLEVYWSYKGHKLLQAEISDDAQFTIHPTFHRVLGIQTQPS